MYVLTSTHLLLLWATFLCVLKRKYNILLLLLLLNHQETKSIFGGFVTNFLFIGMVHSSAAQIRAVLFCIRGSSTPKNSKHAKNAVFQLSSQMHFCAAAILVPDTDLHACPLDDTGKQRRCPLDNRSRLRRRTTPRRGITRTTNTGGRWTFCHGCRCIYTPTVPWPCLPLGVG